jgi:two-component system, chemotaxis family, chemotaxis protein CheY
MLRALVVEDSGTTRRIIAGYLRDLGFDVSEAENGREGLELVSDRGPFALVMVDWNMPEVDGLAFIKAVRADDHHRAMRVVMVTTEVDKPHVVTALTHGADEYVMKPFTREMIVEKLALLGLAGT